MSSKNPPISKVSRVSVNPAGYTSVEVKHTPWTVRLHAGLSLNDGSPVPLCYSLEYVGRTVATALAPATELTETSARKWAASALRSIAARIEEGDSQRKSALQKDPNAWAVLLDYARDLGGLEVLFDAITNLDRSALETLAELPCVREVVLEQTVGTWAEDHPVIQTHWWTTPEHGGTTRSVTSILCGLPDGNFSPRVGKNPGKNTWSFVFPAPPGQPERPGTTHPHCVRSDTVYSSTVEYDTLEAAQEACTASMREVGWIFIRRRGLRHL